VDFNNIFNKRFYNKNAKPNKNVKKQKKRGKNKKSFKNVYYIYAGDNNKYRPSQMCDTVPIKTASNFHRLVFKLHEMCCCHGRFLS